MVTCWFAVLIIFSNKSNTMNTCIAVNNVKIIMKIIPDMIVPDSLLM